MVVGGTQRLSGQEQERKRDDCVASGQGSIIPVFPLKNHLNNAMKPTPAGQ
jgi:hypothetical protein